MTDNEATRTTFARTRPELHENGDEAEAECYKAKGVAEADPENFCLEATFASRT